jgi:NADH:ubiquinone oxidoreductase subunit F (NADH-binding)
MVEVALRLARFFRHESCGKCIPCRDGTYQIVRLLERMKSGASVTCEIDDIVDLASTMQKAAFCGLGQAAPNPVLSCIKHFRSEFEDHCAGKPCDLLGGGERPYGHHH